VTRRGGPQSHNGWEYEMEASFLEIYQEHIHDLLCGEREREGRAYKIVQGECGRNDVSDLTFEAVRCQADVDRIMRVAEGNRTVARTDMNERSSRRCSGGPVPPFSARFAGWADDQRP
jgi:kinesin family protein C1